MYQNPARHADFVAYNVLGSWAKPVMRPARHFTRHTAGLSQMAQSQSTGKPSARIGSAVLVLGDGTVFEGFGFGAAATNVGEVCFNTSMTGYQEIMTDPSYAGQIITFTFPHIGNVGANALDYETDRPTALGVITRQMPTAPASWRSDSPLDAWLARHGLPGIAGIDTRALTRRIREAGAPNGALCHDPSGDIDIAALKTMAAAWPGLDGMDLASKVTRGKDVKWDEGSWNLIEARRVTTKAKRRVVAMDFGCKHHILRCLTDSGCDVTVVPAGSSAKTIMDLRPDGVMLSNGPGDPAATADYAAKEVSTLIDSGVPVFGICIGHQLMSLAMGAKTTKMKRGHRGANHPVKDLATGRIEITSQNHGFVVEEKSLPDSLEITHVSLFDGSVEGVRHRSKPAFCVQYHPESSPGPHDSRYLFERFVKLMDETRKPKRK